MCIMIENRADDTHHTKCERSILLLTPIINSLLPLHCQPTSLLIMFIPFLLLNQQPIIKQLLVPMTLARPHALFKQHHHQFNNELEGVEYGRKEYEW